MAWPESRVVNGKTFWYAVWRVREIVGGKLTRVKHTKALGAVGIDSARAECDAVRITEERKDPKPKHVGVSAALDAFLREKADVQRRRPETIEFYRDRLGPLFVTLGNRGPLRSWQLSWIVDIVAAHPKWSPRTVQMHLTALRTFAKWARSRGYDCPDLARDVKGPTVTKANREAYSVPQLRAILAASVGHRHAVAVALAALAGLSLGDLRALLWRDVDLRRGWITGVRSKTGRPLLIPIAKRLREALKAATPGHPHQVVCTLPKSDSTAYQAWTRICKRAGVSPIGGWKRLRHTYATILDAAHVDGATRRDLMAHAPGSSMEGLYTHADHGRLRAGIGAIDAAVSPRRARLRLPARRTGHVAPSAATGP